MLEVGKHMVKVANHRFVESPSGPKQLSIYFEDATGEGIAWYHTLGWKKDGTYSFAAYKVAEDSLKNLGWDAEAAAYQFEKLDGTNALVGRECEIVVAEHTWEGKTRVEVKYINDPSRPRAGGERMDPAASMSFAERTRQALRQNGKTIPASRPVPRPAPLPIGEHSPSFSETDLERARAAGAGDPIPGVDDAPW